MHVELKTSGACSRAIVSSAEIRRQAEKLKNKSQLLYEAVLVN